MTQRLFHVGSSPAIRAAITKAFGKEPSAGLAVGLGQGDVVVVEAFADLSTREDITGGNAFPPVARGSKRAALRSTSSCAPRIPPAC